MLTAVGSLGRGAARIATVSATSTTTGHAFVRPISQVQAHLSFLGTADSKSSSPRSFSSRSTTAPTTPTTPSTTSTSVPAAAESELKTNQPAVQSRGREKYDEFLRSTGFRIAHRTAMDTLKIQTVVVEPERIVVRMPVTSDVAQPFGLLHGGISLVLSETCASMGAMYNVAHHELEKRDRSAAASDDVSSLKRTTTTPDDRKHASSALGPKFSVVGIEINANHLRAVRVRDPPDYVVAEGIPVHVGRSTHVWETKIRNETTGDLVCTSRCTVMVKRQH